MANHEHGGYYAYEVAFGTIPEIIQFTHYKLRYPVYYYDSGEKYSRNNKSLAIGSDSSSSNIA